MEFTGLKKMSIRNRLIILFISLLALLLAVQGILYYQYDNKFSERLGEAAFEISKDTASIFIYNQDVLYETESFVLDEQGKIIQRQLIRPDNKNIQIHLGDNIHDEVIKLISKDSEFQIPIPRTEIHDTVSELKKRNLWITFALFAIAITLVSFITYSITKPLMALNKAAIKVSQGEFGTQVEINAKKYGRDISETVKQFNKMSQDLVALSEQKAQQQELEHFRELSDISRGLAHNLRNPLNTLQLSLEQQSSDASQKSKFTDIAIEQVQRIENWLKSFTLLMEQGIDKKAVQLEQIIQLALSQIETTQVKLGNIVDMQLLCVETEIAMLLQILLQNAIDASDEVPGNILLTSKCQENQLLISIEDNGKGISPQIKEQLFKPYVTDKIYGTGMGLYIARRLIRHRYNGDLELLDKFPQGTIATIIFPLENGAKA